MVNELKTKIAEIEKQCQELNLRGTKATEETESIIKEIKKLSAKNPNLYLMNSTINIHIGPVHSK